MGTEADLKGRVAEIFKTAWDIRQGKVVPDDASVSLGNKGVEIEATVLYGDLRDSTGLVDRFPAEFAAEIYKTYLLCAATIVRKFGGEVTAYDGDRIMAVFVGNAKNTNAVKSALKLNWAVSNIINPALKAWYGASSYQVEHVVGIDASEIMAAKTGIRSACDLVWVGAAANHAAKLCERRGYPVYITDRVYDRIHDSSKYCENVDMWDFVDDGIYGSSYIWGLG